MSSSTKPSTPLIPLPQLPSIKTLIAKLTGDELNQAIVAATPGLQTLATGNGTTPELIGAWIQEQGAFIGNAALFQKIGVNDLAGAILADLQAYQAELQAAATAGAGATGGDETKSTDNAA